MTRRATLASASLWLALASCGPGTIKAGIGATPSASSSSTNGSNSSSTPVGQGSDDSGQQTSAPSDGGLSVVGSAEAGADAASGGPPADPSLAVAPAIAHLAPGAAQRFTASGGAGPLGAVNWGILEGAAGGAISTDGLYTAPAEPGTYHVVATASGSAGSATGTVIVSTAGDCANLPGVGTWVNISPVHYPGTRTESNFSEAVVVDPFDAAVVWAGTSYAGLFKSTDCGSSWTHINTGRNGDKLDQSHVISLAVDPVNRGVMYSTAFDGASGLWKSTNGGVDWDQLFPPESEVAKVVEYNLINSVAMDPRNPLHLVVAMHGVCKAPYGPVCEAESTDGGKSWRVTTVPVGVDYWVAGAGAFILSETSWLFGTYSNGLWLTRDRGDSWTNVTPASASGSTAGKTLVLPFYPSEVDGRFYLPSMEGILQSAVGDGTRWTLIPNSGGRSVGFAMGDARMYSADQWSASYHTANGSTPTTWTTFAAPAELPADQGSLYLSYDKAHHLLYSSNFAGGLWRVRTQ